MKIYYNNNDKEILELAINNKENILLEGESGCGKTSMIKEIANERGCKLIRINLNGQTGVEDIIGYKTLINGNVDFINGALVDAMINGDWIVFDELNACSPEVLFSLQSLLDDDRFIVLKEKNNEVIRAHDNFRFFATQNPPTNYAGTKELNQATLSRFGCVLTVEYTEHEIDVLVERTNIDKATARNLVTCAQYIRQENKNGNLTANCNTRDLLQCCKMIQMGVKPEQAVLVTIINKATEDEREKLRKIFELNLNMKFNIKIGNKIELLDEKEIKEKEKEINNKLKQIEEIRKEMREINESNQKEIEELSNNVYKKIDNIMQENLADNKELLKAWKEIFKN